LYQIDLNCDLGEGFGVYKIGMTEEILDYITSANIACGFHAGDPSVMRKTVRLALEKGVKIGAHPGLPDLVGFGRRNMDISPQEAYDMVVYQLGALYAFILSEGADMHHVKPHGALYNMAARSKNMSEAIAEAIYKVNPGLILYGLSGSELVKAGEKIGLQTYHEVFADRTYQEDGSLTPRRQPNALITDYNRAVVQITRMIKEGKVLTEQGVDIAIRANTICIHGDGTQALVFAREIHHHLESLGILVK
jgi:UPF0271 protein